MQINSYPRASGTEPEMSKAGGEEAGKKVIHVLLVRRFYVLLVRSLYI